MNLRHIAQTLKRELAVYQCIARHPRAPRDAKWWLSLALGYALMPFDLIPDFIPIIGHLDDALIVPGLIWIALKRVPPDVVRECRENVDGEQETRSREEGV